MQYIFISVSFLLLGCTGFRLTGTMCESLQPGEVIRECQPYDDDAAAKASLPLYDEDGKCLKCDTPEKIEIRN